MFEKTQNTDHVQKQVASRLQSIVKTIVVIHFNRLINAGITSDPIH